MEEFVEEWIMHKIGGEARTDLADSDKKWEQFHHQLKQKDPNHLLADQQVLFRVHTTNEKEPQKEDYDDLEQFKLDYQNYQTHRPDTRSEIQFDNHWVSFTDSFDVITSDEFAKKRMRGLVIIARPKKAIKVYPQVKDVKGDFFDEKEVVAPLDEHTTLNVLSFHEFVANYQPK